MRLKYTTLHPKDHPAKPQVSLTNPFRTSILVMTMRYPHIGLADQAKALAGLRVPKTADTKEGKKKKASWQRYGSGTRSIQFRRLPSNRRFSRNSRHNPMCGSPIKEWFRGSVSSSALS